MFNGTEGLHVVVRISDSQAFLYIFEGIDHEMHIIALIDENDINKINLLFIYIT